MEVDTEPWPLLTSLMHTHCPSTDSFHRVTCKLAYKVTGVHPFVLLSSLIPSVTQAVEKHVPPTTLAQSAGEGLTHVTEHSRNSSPGKLL